VEQRFAHLDWLKQKLMKNIPVVGFAYPKDFRKNEEESSYTSSS